MALWQIWLAIALGLLIVEMLTGTFVFLCLGLGALLAALTAVFTDNWIIVLIVFSIVTLLSLLFVRPMVNKMFFKNSHHVKTNAEALEGAKGRVLETIDNNANQGRVFVYGDDWKAESVDGGIIAVGDNVEVVKVNSNILIVKHIK